MIVLGFDASSSLLTVGLADGARVIGRWSQTASRARGNMLDSVIDHALAESGLRRCQIDGMALATGPGSLTALRIAWATAAGWSQATGLPVVGWSVPELQQRYWFETMRGYDSAVNQFESLLCLIHHRGEEYYAYRMSRTERLQPPGVVTMQADSIEHRDLLIGGPGLLGKSDQWRRVLGAAARIVPEDRAVVHGDQVAIWGAQALAAGERLTLERSPLEYGLPPTFRKSPQHA
jgi:tRNA threonylcarbamoyl adenosine modification protein YeaZ